MEKASSCVPAEKKYDHFSFLPEYIQVS
jgi:hypothetical protein